MNWVIEKVVANTEVVGKCWMWSLSKNDGEAPQLKYQGKGYAARRVAYQAYHGVTLSKIQSIKPKCGKTYCLSPCCLSIVGDESKRVARQVAIDMREKANRDEPQTILRKRIAAVERDLVSRIHSQVGMWKELVK